MCAARGNSGALNQGRDVRLNTGTNPGPFWAIIYYGPLSLDSRYMGVV